MTAGQRLEPPALEAEFRAGSLPADRRVTAGLALLTIVFVTVSVPATDVAGVSARATDAMLALRALDVAAAAVASFLIWRAPQPPRYDTIVTLWLAAWFLSAVAENALLPANSTSFIAWDVFLCFGVYTAIPLPIGRKAALAGIITIGDLVVLWTREPRAQSLDLMDVTLAYVCANMVGWFVSRELHTVRRRAFVALKQQMETSTALASALSEVKTLQGIIPICSFCKNIRGNADEWQAVEAYVRARSDAQFSHGVCPDCMAVHYPDIEAGS